MPQADETAPHPAQPLIDQAARIELDLLHSVGSFGVAMADAWANLVAEGASFAAERIRQEARTLQAMLHCRTPGDLQRIHAAFVQRAIDEYQAEAGRMTALMDAATRPTLRRKPN
jgi:hypothetical protein